MSDDQSKEPRPDPSTEPLLIGRGFLVRRDTPESKAFWDFVAETARRVWEERPSWARENDVERLKSEAGASAPLPASSPQTLTELRHLLSCVELDERTAKARIAELTAARADVEAQHRADVQRLTAERDGARLVARQMQERLAAAQQGESAAASSQQAECPKCSREPRNLRERLELTNTPAYRFGRRDVLESIQQSIDTLTSAFPRDHAEAQWEPSASSSLQDAVNEWAVASDALDPDLPSEQFDKASQRCAVARERLRKFAGTQGEPAASSPAPSLPTGKELLPAYTFTEYSPTLGMAIVALTAEQADAVKRLLTGATSSPAVEGLPATWRHVPKREPTIGVFDGTTQWWQGYERALRRCADELEAALRRPVAQLPQQET